MVIQTKFKNKIINSNPPVTLIYITILLFKKGLYSLHILFLLFST